MNSSANHEWQPKPWKVLSRRRENHETVTLEVAPVHDADKMSIGPGQFNMIYGFGIGEIPISLSGQTKSGLLHTIRSVGAISQYLSKLTEGARIGIRGPFGNTWQPKLAQNKDVVVIAGGVGLAPLRPLINHFVRHRQQYRNINLLYGGREPGQMLFPDEVEKWSKNIRVLQIVDHATEGWSHHVGVVTQLLPLALFDPNQSLAFVCGPEIMMRFATSMLAEAGIDPQHILLSMERNMKCAIGLCGHCQWGQHFICKSGPVYRYGDIKAYLNRREM